MIYIIYLLGLINFIPLCSMLPHTGQQTIKIICSYDQKTTMPINIVGMSTTLREIINNDKPNTIIKKGNSVSINPNNINNISPIPFSSYSCATINDLCNVLEDFSLTKIINLEKIKGYTLEKMITMSNAFHFFDFSDNENLTLQWNKKIDSEIYLRCKDISWQELQQQVIPLYPSPLHQDLVNVIFCNPIINKIKFELIKTAFTRKKISLPKASIGGITFSPDSSRFASIQTSLPGPSFIEGSEKHATVEMSLFQNDAISVNAATIIPLIKNLWVDCSHFCYDNQKFIIGDGNDILIYTIDDNRVIGNKPAQTLSHPLIGEQYEQQKISLNQSGTLMVSYNGNTLALWHFNPDGTVNTASHILLANTEIISPIQFDADGTICVISKNTDNASSTLYIFNPDNGTNSQSTINDELCCIDFYAHDKKFIAMPSSNPTNLYVYDFTDINNISKKRIFSSEKLNKHSKPRIILNDMAMIILLSAATELNSIDKQLLLVDINNHDNKTLINTNFPFSYFFMSPDDKKIILEQKSGAHCSRALYYLLIPQENIVLNSIDELGIEPILRLDRIVRKIEDASTLRQYNLPQVPQIIELLQKIEIHEYDIAVQEIEEATTIPKTVLEGGRWSSQEIGQKSVAYHAIIQAIGQEKKEMQQQPINLEKPETIAATPQVLLKPETERTASATADIPQQISKTQPQPQPENNEQKSGILGQFFLDMSSKVYSIISTAGSWFSGMINWVSEWFK